MFKTYFAHIEVQLLDAKDQLFVFTYAITKSSAASLQQIAKASGHEILVLQKVLLRHSRVSRREEIDLVFLILDYGRVQTSHGG